MLTKKRIQQINEEYVFMGLGAMRELLKRTPGRYLIAILLGSSEKPNFSRADRFLYQGKIVHADENKIRSCYRVVRLIYENEQSLSDSHRKRLRRDTPDNIPRNWLLISSIDLNDRAPIVILRDGYRDLDTVFEAANRFIGSK